MKGGDSQPIIFSLMISRVQSVQQQDIQETSILDKPAPSSLRCAGISLTHTHVHVHTHREVGGAAGMHKLGMSLE